MHPGSATLSCLPSWPQIMQIRISFRSRSDLVLDADHALDFSSYLVLQACISFCSVSDKSGASLFLPCSHQIAVAHMSLDSRFVAIESMFSFSNSLFLRKCGSRTHTGQPQCNLRCDRYFQLESAKPLKTFKHAFEPGTQVRYLAQTF